MGESMITNLKINNAGDKNAGFDSSNERHTSNNVLESLNEPLAVNDNTKRT